MEAAEPIDVQSLIDRFQCPARPRGNYILVLPIVSKLTSGESDLILTDENREEPEAGIVFAVGPGDVSAESGRPVPVMSHVGEIVWYGRFAGINTTVMTPAGPLAALAMLDHTLIMAEDAGSFAVVMHEDNPRKVHKAGYRCEDCRTLKEIAEQGAAQRANAAERQRLIDERSAASVTL